MNDETQAPPPEDPPAPPFRKKGGRPKGSKGKKRQTFAKVAAVSTAGITDETLLDRIAELQAELASEREKRGEAEQRALDMASAQGALMQSEIREVPTTKKVSMRMQKHDAQGNPVFKIVGYKDDANGRPILQPVFENVDVPTYFYKIDMPPCGGIDLKINGKPYYHGATYEFDEHTLRSVKDIVYRVWKHDSDIHGSDENFYRQKQMPALSARAR